MQSKLPAAVTVATSKAKINNASLEERLTHLETLVVTQTSSTSAQNVYSSPIIDEEIPGSSEDFEVFQKDAGLDSLNSISQGPNTSHTDLTQHPDPIVSLFNNTLVSCVLAFKVRGINCRSVEARAFKKSG